MRLCEIIGVSGEWESLKCREGYVVRNKVNHRNRIYVLNSTAKEDIADLLVLLARLNQSMKKGGGSK